MPTYEYLCPFCGNKFTKMNVKIADRALPKPCTQCNTNSELVPSLTASRKDHIEP